jgi:hypothetical protein
VVLPRVDFDDQAVVGPVGVDFAAVDDVVRARQSRDHSRERLFDGALDQDVGEVDDRLCGGGDGDAVLLDLRFVGTVTSTGPL